MNQRDINRRVEQFRKAGEREKLSPPQVISMPRQITPAIGSMEVRLAKVISVPVNGTRLICNLLDNNGIEITSGEEANVLVVCFVFNTTDISETLPHLNGGELIIVIKKKCYGQPTYYSSDSALHEVWGDAWICISPYFQYWSLCSE